MVAMKADRCEKDRVGPGRFGDCYRHGCLTWRTEARGEPSDLTPLSFLGHYYVSHRPDDHSRSDRGGRRINQPCSHRERDRRDLHNLDPKSGVLSGESATYGDGETTDANAGLVKCGATTNIDYTHIWQHAYRTPGSYQFADDVNVIGPPPSCRSITVTGKATVIVVG